MAKIKKITIGNRAIAAGRKRFCHHNRKHMIVKGEVCLEIREGMGWKGYCAKCGIAMVNRGTQELGILLQHLSNIKFP